GLPCGQTLQADSNRGSSGSPISADPGQTARERSQDPGGIYRIGKTRSRRRRNFPKSRKGRAHGRSYVDERRTARKTLSANRRIVAALVERNSEAELGPILHEYREGCGIALELHEAEGRRNHCQRQASDFDRLQRYSSRYP